MTMESSETQLRQQIHTPSFVFNPNVNKYRRDIAPAARPASAITMTSNDMPARTETMAALQGVWTTPTSQGMRPRPATIHEGFSYCMGEGYEGLPAWDSSTLPGQQTPSDAMSSSRPISMHQDFYPVTMAMENSKYGIFDGGAGGLTMTADGWVQKHCEDHLEIHGLDAEMNIGQAYTADEAIPILDLRYPGAPMEGERPNFDGSVNPRRMSGSSFTMSTSGGLSDMTSYEDFSAALSDAPSLSSEYPPPSNRNSLMSSTQLSPVASPRMTPQTRSDLVRTQSRGRASPSPRPGVRSAPYTVDGGRNKRWSTGSYGTMSSRRPSPFAFHHHPPDAFVPRMPSRHSSPTTQQGQMPLNFGNLQAVQQPPFLMGHRPPFPHGNMLLPSQLPSQAFDPRVHQFDAPAPLLSHNLFRMLSSNGDPHSLHGHYTDLSDPPDLYASLHEEQMPPPPEDLNPEDPDLVPHEQDLRFEGDLYTPRWVRGHGNKREGWCGICKPGRWLVLKNSAFWYDKSFTHGISAATGSPFQEPQETRRMDGNPDVWEGLCCSCNEWIALVSSKKKGTTWFRHAYKCHAHPKIKDAPKRRRESGHARLAASTMAKPRAEPQAPLTPQTTPAMSASNTPTPARMQPQQQSTPAEPPQQQRRQRQHHYHHHHHQYPVPPPAPAHLQIQVSHPPTQQPQPRSGANPLDGLSNMI